MLGALTNEADTNSEINFASTMTILVGSSSTRIHRRIGVLTTSTNAGTVLLRWAQNVAAIEDTILHAGSYLILERLA